MRTERLLSALCLLALATASAAAAAPQNTPTDPPRLFASESAARPSQALVPNSTEELLIELDPETVAANPRTLRIELPGHPPLEAVRKRFVEYRTDWKSWSGILRTAGSRGRPVGHIHIGYHGDRLTALVDFRGERYRIAGGGGESHRLARLSDAPGSPLCGVDESEGGLESLLHHAQELGESEAPAALQTAESTTPVRLDVLAIYPSAVLRFSASAEQSFYDYIEDTIAQANDIFMDSGADAYYNLVGTVPVTGTQPTQSGVRSGLSWLNSNPAEAVALRNAFGADFVTLFIPESWHSTTQPWCGIANLPDLGEAFSNPFTSIRVDCGVGDYTVPHEMAHNLGLRHDDDPEPELAVTPYAFGYLFTVNQQQKATVMGCICSDFNEKPDCPGTVDVCGRVPLFSSPALSYLGLVTVGDATHDNARTARERAPSYAAFLPQSTNTPPTANFTVSCTGRVCSFSAASSTDNVALPTTAANYYWDFGDNTTGTGRTTTRTYTAGGTYRVHLVVTDSGGQRDVATGTASPWNPLYEGQLETVNCRSITGWAWDQVDPNGQIKVELLKDGSLVTTLTANFYRQDLFNAGKGNGIHGFMYTPGTTWDDGLWHQVGARTVGPPATTLTGSPQPIICKVPFFASGTPASFLDTGGQSWSVGNVFSSRITGYVTHLRYYKAAEEAGVHTLKLWTDSGQPLDEVSVDFGTAGTAGWKTGKLAGNGIQITAGTRFVVTVTTVTKQSKTDCQFSSPSTRDPLTAHGGRWQQGNGIFPQTNSCSNFWTDVYFEQ